jgi:hypothetical protein
MGKAGHIARILAPYGLTIKSLICIIMVGLSCTTASSNLLYYLYVMRISSSLLSNEMPGPFANTHFLHLNLQNISLESKK